MTILEQDTMYAIKLIPNELKEIKESISFLTIIMIALSSKGKTELESDLEKANNIVKNLKG